MPSTNALVITPFPGNFIQTWSDGSLFTGFLLVGIIAPTYSGVTVPFVGYDNIPSDASPTFILCPITDGIISSACGLIPSANLQPPNCAYVAWLYDVTKKLVAGPSTLTATSTTITVPTFSPVKPAYGVTAPTPN
jgi:hypothetical protein